MALHRSQIREPLSRRVAFYVLCSAVLAKLCFMTAYAIRARWVMDEFAHGYFSKYLGLDLYRVVQPVKTALPLIPFHLPLTFFSDPLAVLYTWRIETLIVAILICAAVVLASGSLSGSRSAALLSLFTMLSFSNFLERAFRVRNDTFAVLFAVTALAVVIHDRNKHRGAWLSGVLVGLAFLCTQKSVFFVVSLGIAEWVIGWASTRWRAAIGCTLRYMAGIGIPLLGYCVAFGGWAFADVLTAIFLGPLRPGLVDAFAHPGLRRFVWQTLSRNALVYLLCVGGLVLVIAKWRGVEPRVRAAVGATAVVTASVFLHSQPWPYVFVMAMPFLALWPPHILATLPSRWRVSGLILIVGLLSLSFVRNISYLKENKSTQFSVVQRAAMQMGPRDRYFDGIGMIPTREIAGRYPWWWWDAPNIEMMLERWNSGDTRGISDILHDHPKLWIINYRFRPMRGIIGPILGKSTVRISPYILLSGLEADPGRTVVFENLWPGAYSVFDGEGHAVNARLIVDAIDCELPCQITAGQHRISVVGSQPLFVLPSGFSPVGRIPYRGSVPDLFAGIYDF